MPTARSAVGPTILPMKCPKLLDGENGMVQGVSNIERRPTPAKICPARLTVLAFAKRNINAPMTMTAPGAQKKKKACTVSSMPYPVRKTL